MNLIRRVSAIYKEQELPEYRGNPLIEALPEALTEDEVLLEMSYFPEIEPLRFSWRVFCLSDQAATSRSFSEA